MVTIHNNKWTIRFGTTSLNQLCKVSRELFYKACFNKVIHMIAKELQKVQVECCLSEQYNLCVSDVQHD
jgi:hypothetical protein